MEKLKSIFTQEVRGYIYRSLVAIGALLAGYGYLTTNEIALWLGVATSLLNVMPSANTSISSEK